MKNTLFLFLLLVTGPLLAQTPYDTNRIAVFRLDSLVRNDVPGSKGLQAFAPTPEEIRLADSLLQVCIKDNDARSGKNTMQLLIDRGPYKIQLVPCVNEKGEKTMWANALCESYTDREPAKDKNRKKRHSPSTNWKKEVMVVHDGGPCFFNVVLDLHTRQYRDLYINGL